MKMLEQLIETVRQTTSANTSFWLSNESGNKLLEEAENIRFEEGGNIQLKFNSGDVVGLKTEGCVCYGEAQCAHVRLMYLNSEFKAVKARVSNCKIL